VFFSEQMCEVKPNGDTGRVECPVVLEDGSVLGTSEDGSYVYYVSNGVQAQGASPGDCAGYQSGQRETCSLYVAHQSGGVWAKRFVATLSGSDYPDFRPFLGLEDRTSRVSPNGQWLTFMSDRDLTGYDNRDAQSGRPDEEVYLYDAETQRLVCASCEPTGARPTGVTYQSAAGHSFSSLIAGDRVWEATTWLAADLPGGDAWLEGVAQYQERYLSDSGRLFFNSLDPLVSKDVNGTWDVYEYEPEGGGSETARCGPAATNGSDLFKPARSFEVEGVKGEEGAGCVGLISSGTSAQESAFMDASETGGDVFFLTTAKLSTADFDKAYDIYDAHECTSSSPCVPQPLLAPPECTTADACRAAPAPQPSIFGAPSSATFSGVGNLTPTPAASKKTTKKAVKCKKPKKLRHGKCVKVKSKAKKSKKAKKANRAADDRRASR
jgi:hypothetical protein